MQLTTVRLVMGTERVERAGGGPLWPRSCIRAEEYHAKWDGLAWRWKKTRTIAKARRKSELFAAHPEFQRVGRGGKRGSLVSWDDVRQMVMPWAWVGDTIAGLIGRMDAGDACGPILADALQDAAFPEACPVLDILRSWE